MKTEYTRHQIAEAIEHWRRILENMHTNAEFTPDEARRFAYCCEKLPSLGGIEVSDVKHFELLVKEFIKWWWDGGDAFDGGDVRNPNAKMFNIISNDDIADIVLSMHDHQHCADFASSIKTASFSQAACTSSQFSDISWNL